MKNTLSQFAASDFACPRLVEGEKFAATPATGMRVGPYYGSGVPAPVFDAAAVLSRIQPGPSTTTVRGRMQIAGVKGIAARGAPV